MRNIFVFLMIASALAVLPAKADTISTYHLEPGDSLGALLDDTNTPDSLIISGAGNKQTIRDLRDYLWKHPTVRGLNLQKLKLTDNKLPSGAFLYQNPWRVALKYVTLPETLETIGRSAFEGLGIEHVDLPQTLVTIKEFAFIACEKLNRIDLPDGLKYICEGALSNMPGLTEINLPDGLLEIGEGAFALSGLSEVIVPASIDKLNDNVFNECRRLKKVTLPDNLKSIGSDVFGNTSLEEINWPSQLDSIGSWAFDHCSLTSVELPQQLKYVGAFAFSECEQLRSITLPSSLDSISVSAIKGCTDLKVVRCLKNTPPGIVEESLYRRNPVAFYPSGDVTLYVPYDSSDNYRCAEWWKEFCNILEMKPDSITLCERKPFASDSSFYCLDGTKTNRHAKGLIIYRGRKILKKR